MFRKLNIKTLVIILVVLVAIYFITDMIGDRERSFRSTLVEVDTARVTDVIINLPGDDKQIQLMRTGSGQWEVSTGTETYTADKNVVKKILNQYVEMKPERVAATSPGKWTQYEVNDTTGINVVLKDDGKELANVYIGKFSYSQQPQTQVQNPYQQQQRGKMTSFVRLADEDKVFAVDGFLKMEYQKDINAYRNKSLVSVNKSDISRVVFNYPGKQFTLSKEEEKWMLDGQAADSAKTVRYLGKIARLNSSNFVDPSTPKAEDAVQTVRIEGNNFSPVQIKAYPTTDTTMKYVVTSSYNPDAEFDGSKANLHEKVFVDQNELLPDEE